MSRPGGPVLKNSPGEGPEVQSAAMGYLAWYGLSSLLFGIVLYFPLRKLMLAMNINREQRRLKREVTQEERDILRRKVSIWAAGLAVTFAFFYNRFLFFKFFSQP